MTITPKPLTMQTAPMFEAWAAKLDTVIKEGQADRIARSIGDVIESDPEFAAAIEQLTTTGPDDAAKLLATWAKSKPVIAARMHKLVSQIPMTLGALRIALACIRETAQDADAIDYEAITYEQARDYCALILDMTT